VTPESVQKFTFHRIQVPEIVLGLGFVAALVATDIVEAMGLVAADIVEAVGLVDSTEGIVVE